MCSMTETIQRFRNKTQDSLGLEVAAEALVIVNVIIPQGKGLVRSQLLSLKVICIRTSDA